MGRRGVSGHVIVNVQGSIPGPQGWHCRVASGAHCPMQDKLATARETAQGTPEHTPCGKSKLQSRPLGKGLSRNPSPELAY